MPEYLLLLHEQPSDFADLSPEDLENIIGEYIEWRKKLEADGKFAGGQKLRDEGGRHLAGWNGDFRVTDGPYAEAKEVIGGFFAVKAADYNEAVEISKECPHLKYGGRIELREIEPTQ